MSDWYCQIDGNSSGPFSLDELRFLVNRGRLGPDADVRIGKRGLWTKAGAVRELFPAGLGPERLTLSGVLEPRPTEPDPAEPAAASPDPDPPATAVLGATPSPAAVIHHDQDADETRQRMIIASCILAAVLLLFLLLLLLLSWDRFVGGSQGTVASVGVGGQQGDGIGEDDGDGGEGTSDDNAKGSDEMSDEILDEGELTADMVEQDASTGDQPSREDPPPDAIYRVKQFEAAPPPAQGNHGGGLGDFQDRVDREGGQTGEVQITLIWNNVNDLDLHVICPSGERISYQHVRSQCNGQLDVDMNAGGQISNKPVENVFWPEGGAPQGKYTVIVKHYANHGARDPTKFEVAIKNGGGVRKFSGSVSVGEEKQVNSFRKG